MCSNKGANKSTREGDSKKKKNVKYDVMKRCYGEFYLFAFFCVCFSRFDHKITTISVCAFGGDAAARIIILFGTFLAETNQTRTVRCVDWVDWMCVHNRRDDRTHLRRNIMMMKEKKRKEKKNSFTLTLNWWNFPTYCPVHDVRTKRT